MNKVREGYKITEIGDIPIEWEVRYLEDVCEILDSYRKPIKASDREEMKGDIPYYGASGVIDWINDFIFDEELILLGEDGENLNSRNTDLAFKISGKSWVNNHAHVFRIANKNRDNIDFMVYYLESKDYSRYIAGSAQPKITQAQCRKFLLPSPDLKEQEKIASILSTVDEQIDNVDALIEKNKELKKGLMQTLLTKGIGHTKFKKTEIGEIPEEWQVKRLGNVCEVKSSKRVYQSDYIDSGVPFYRSKEIIELSKGNLPTVELFIARDKFEEFKEKYGVPKLGDLMITSVGSVGKTWVCDGREFYYKDGNLTQIISNNEINTKYISYVFECEYLIKQYLGQSSGSAQVALTLEKLKNLLVIFPTIDEQVSIVNILLSIDKKIEEYENKKKKLEELKKGLMQQLLTGKIRV